MVSNQCQLDAQTRAIAKTEQGVFSFCCTLILLANQYIQIDEKCIIGENCLGVLMPNYGSKFKCMLMQKVINCTENSQK